MEMRPWPLRMKCVGLDHAVHTWRMSGVHKETRKHLSMFVGLCSSSCRGKLCLEAVDSAGKRQLFLKTALNGSWQSKTYSKMPLCCCMSWMDRLALRRSPRRGRRGMSVRWHQVSFAEQQEKPWQMFLHPWMNRNLHPLGHWLQTRPMQLNLLLWEIKSDAESTLRCNKYTSCHVPPCPSHPLRQSGVFEENVCSLPSAWWLHIYLSEHKNARSLGQWSGLYILTAGSRFCSLKPSEK